MKAYYLVLTLAVIVLSNSALANNADDAQWLSQCIADNQDEACSLKSAWKGK
jgi:hypothetical protein